MIRAKNEFGATQVRPELDAHGYSGQYLVFSGAVTSLRGPKGATTVGNNVFYIVLDLAQHSTKANIASVCIKNVLSGLSQKSEDWGVYKWRPENTEGSRTTCVLHKCNVFSSQGKKRCRNVSKIRNKAPVVTHKS